MTTVRRILGAVLFTLLSLQSQAVVLRNSTFENDTAETQQLLSGDGGALRRVRRNADPCTNRHGSERNCLWPKAMDGKVNVPYVIDESFNERTKKFITITAEMFSLSTCVHFTPYNFENDYVFVHKSEDGSQSAIGRQGGAQGVYLTESDSQRLRVVQHELLHALGFHHEFSRSDRDQHIRVNWDNIDQKNHNNFQKLNTDNMETPYDFDSVLQYNRMAGSKNGRPTLEAVFFQQNFGTAPYMSDRDIELVNRLYCTEPSAGGGWFDWLSGLFWGLG